MFNRVHSCSIVFSLYLSLTDGVGGLDANMFLEDSLSRRLQFIFQTKSERCLPSQNGARNVPNFNFGGMDSLRLAMFNS